MRISVLSIGLLLTVIVGSLWASAADDPPTEWIDASTGHRVIRLSREPGSASLYYHQNCVLARRPEAHHYHGQRAFSTINLKTRAIEQIVEGRVSVIVTGRKSGQVYYTKRVGNETIVYATHLETHATKEITKLTRGSVASLNADETLLLGSYTEGNNQVSEQPPNGAAGQGPSQQPPLGPDGKPLTFAEQKRSATQRPSRTAPPDGDLHHQYQDRRDESRSPRDRLAQSSPVFAHGSKLDYVLSRRPLA